MNCLCSIVWSFCIVRTLTIVQTKSEQLVLVQFCILMLLVFLTMLESTFLVCLIFIIGTVSLEVVNFDEAEDYWKEIIKYKTTLLTSLQQLLQENKDVPRKKLILKIAVWAKANGVQVRWIY